MAQHAPNKAHKRYLRNYLLNRGFQLRYTATVVLLCSLLLAVLGFYWHREMAVASDIVEVKVLTDMREADAQRIQDDLRAHDRLRVAVLLGVGLLLCLSVAGFTIVLTHKVAGPLYVIQRTVERLAAGDLTPLRPMRKGDQLVEFHQAFASLVLALRRRAEADDQALHQAEKALRAAEAAGDDEEERAEALATLGQTLAGLRRQKQAALDPKASQPPPTSEA